jgi:hypothetical protein
MHLHNLQGFLSFNFAKFIKIIRLYFTTLKPRRIRLSEDDVGASKYVGVFMIYKILLI